MGSIAFHNPLFHIEPAPAANTTVLTSFRPEFLLINGLNFPIEISTASILLSSSPEKKVESVLVFAHFDTGASSTSIDINLAKEMNLDTMGVCNIMTAAGEIPMPVFTVNIGFPGTNLSPFIDLKINSCKLGYNSAQKPSPKNFGILLGRDIMSRWNIVWNGPSSTVFIND